MRWLTKDWLTCKATAAAEKLPRSATAQKMVRSCSWIAIIKAYMN